MVTGTEALMTSTAAQQVNQITAGVWDNVPTECGPLSNYPGGIVYGTPGNDVINGGNQKQIIMGLGGNDVINGGNAGDCLVGGAGNDTLNGGNGHDILIGGAGNDTLNGGNGPDILYAGGDPGDVCIGGRGPTTFVGCPTMTGKFKGNVSTPQTLRSGRPLQDPVTVTIPTPGPTLSPTPSPTTTATPIESTTGSGPGSSS
jgi:hypothetical protein